MIIGNYAVGHPDNWITSWVWLINSRSVCLTVSLHHQSRVTIRGGPSHCTDHGCKNKHSLTWGHLSSRSDTVNSSMILCCDTPEISIFEQVSRWDLLLRSTTNYCKLMVEGGWYRGEYPENDSVPSISRYRRCWMETYRQTVPPKSGAVRPPTHPRATGGGQRIRFSGQVYVCLLRVSELLSIAKLGF